MICPDTSTAAIEIAALDLEATYEADDHAILLRALSAQLTEAQEQRDELKRAYDGMLAVEFAACLCGCPADDHENYGEDGESCEDETHVCLRAPTAIVELFLRLREQLADAHRHLGTALENVQAVTWRTHTSAGIEKMDAARAYYAAHAGTGGQT